MQIKNIYIKGFGKYCETETTFWTDESGLMIVHYLTKDSI